MPKIIGMTLKAVLLAYLLSLPVVLVGQTPTAPDAAGIKSQLTEAEFAEYRRWVAIGVGGLPHTLEGYRTLRRLNKMLPSPLDVTHLKPMVGQRGALAGLKNLRAGERGTRVIVDALRNGA
jgi:hypothetical protein